jgi:5-methyltetrahydrofolate--homocysteine methyltransferase
MLPLATANANRPRIDFRPADLPAPSFLGSRALTDVQLGEVARYIDWTFFFTAWELKGRFPEILSHPEYGAAARDLYEHGKRILEDIVATRALRANAVYGFWPANSDGNDIVLWRDAARRTPLARFPMLRQQQVKTDDKPYLCLADFVAPIDSGLVDHVGAFVVTAGIGVEALVAKYEKEHDDYSAIITKALADRLAEALAEMLHERVRKEWGYGASEDLSMEDLIAERYRGIRPAFGYPACPDHSEKRRLFDVLDAARIGVSLTETCAMTPPASVSGIYLAHPEARYFLLGRIDRDQVEDYARRKETSVSEVERWLGPNLSYEP